jgi:hypothetical protein
MKKITTKTKQVKTKKLQAAGILHEDHGLSDAQIKQLESLSEDEISALVDIKKKLTKFDWPLGTVVVKPQMF